MVNVMQFDIKGGKELTQALKKMPDEIAKKVLASAARAGAKVIQEEATNSAPRGKAGRRGKVRKTKHGSYTELINLRTQIKITKAKGTGKGVALKITTGKAFWGMFSEFGTKDQAAKPWMRPAFERSRVGALQAAGDALGKGIENAAKKLAGPLAKSGLIKKRRR